MADEAEWSYVGHSIGAPFLIDGIDVWKHEWVRAEGKTARVRDPVYHSSFEIPVYEVTQVGMRVIFASGEFSNGVFGFFVPKDPNGHHR